MTDKLEQFSASSLRDLAGKFNCQRDNAATEKILLDCEAAAKQGVYRIAKPWPGNAVVGKLEDLGFRIEDSGNEETCIISWA